MSFDSRKNFAYSLVATAPSPATSGTSLVVTAADGAKFPAVPFNATIWPAGVNPLTTNGEIVRVTNIVTDTFTIVRTQESTSARTVVVGDQIMAGLTSKSLTDIEQEKQCEVTVGATNADYTTVGAAIAAGYGSIYVRRGTYTESANLNTYTLTSKTLTIIGEDAASTIIQLNASTTGFFNFKYANSFISNLTIKAGASSLGSATDGWAYIQAAGCTFNNVIFLGQDSTSYTTGRLVSINSSGHQASFTNCQFLTHSSGSSVFFNNGANDTVLTGCYFKENKCTILLGTPNNVTIDRMVVQGCTFNCTGDQASFYRCIYFQAAGGITTRWARIIGNHFIINGASITGSRAVQMNGDLDAWNIVEGNTFDLGTGGGGAFYSDTGIGITVTGNNITKSGIKSDPIIYFVGGSYNIVSNNNIKFNGTPTASLIGIKMEADYCQVMGNTVQGLTGTTNIGINIASGTNAVVTGNISRNNTVNYTDAGTNTQMFGNMHAELQQEKRYISGKNVSGGSLTAGTIVVINAVAAGNEFTTTTTAGNKDVFGVVAETIANNAVGLVQIAGKTVNLKVDGTTDIAVGDYISCFTAAGIGQKAASTHTAIAYSLEAYTTNDSNGVLDAIIINPKYIP